MSNRSCAREGTEVSNVSYEPIVGVKSTDKKPSAREVIDYLYCRVLIVVALLPVT